MNFPLWISRVSTPPQSHDWFWPLNIRALPDQTGVLGVVEAGTACKSKSRKNCASSTMVMQIERGWAWVGKVVLLCASARNWSQGRIQCTWVHFEMPGCALRTNTESLAVSALGPTLAITKHEESQQRNQTGRPEEQTGQWKPSSIAWWWLQWLRGHMPASSQECPSVLGHGGGSWGGVQSVWKTVANQGWASLAYVHRNCSWQYFLLGSSFPMKILKTKHHLDLVRNTLNSIFKMWYFS